MRLKFVVLAAATAALALPAAAQSYNNGNCAVARKDGQIGGALVGGLLGGVLGSNVAGRGVREEGTAVGAVLGALAGSAVGRDSVNCPSNEIIYARPSQPAYGYQGYGEPYAHPRYASAPPPPPAYPDYDGRAYPQTFGRGYGDDDRRYSDNSPTTTRYNELAGRGSGAYNNGSEFAGRECTQTDQITRLPDGSEIRRPVEVCRDAYYSGWAINN